MQNAKNNIKALFLVQCALFAAILCILSPLAIPIGPIPVTLGVFAVMLTGVVLDWKRACMAVLVYILLGVIGLPVFSGGNSGPGVIAGPTGGYLWAYVPMAAIIAMVGGAPREREIDEDLRTFVACLLSMIVLYLLGTFQFTLVADSSWSHALAVCVYPFVLLDTCKAICATLLGVRSDGTVVSAHPMASSKEAAANWTGLRVR